MSDVDAVVIDIDGTLTGELVLLLNLLPREIHRIVVTARHRFKGEDGFPGYDKFAETWEHLEAMGLEFDELWMREQKWQSPARFKAGIVDKLEGWGVRVVLAIDDDPSVSQRLRSMEIPVLQIHPK